MSVVDPVVQDDFSQMRGRYSFFPQMETVLQELSTGIKVIDSYDDDVLCLSHIHEEDLNQDNGLSSTSMRLMQKLKKRTSASDIPITLINMLDAAKMANEKFQRSKNQPREWLSLFRSPSSTDAKRCSLCHSEKLKPCSGYVLDFEKKTPVSSSRSWYNQTTPQSPRSLAIQYQDVNNSDVYSYRSAANPITSTPALSRLGRSSRQRCFQSQKLRHSTASLPNPKVYESSPKCCDSRRSNISTGNHPLNVLSFSPRPTYVTDATFCDIKSGTSSVTRSIQCSKVDIPTPGDHVIYARKWDVNNGEDEECEDDYSIQATASTVSSSSSRYQERVYTPSDLEDAFLAYLNSQNLPDENQLACLGNLKRVVDRMEIHKKEGQKSIVETTKCEEKRVEGNVSVSIHKEKSDLDSCLVHRLSIPPTIKSSHSSLLDKDAIQSQKVAKTSSEPKQCTATRSFETLKRKQYKQEMMNEEADSSKRKNIRPPKKPTDTTIITLRPKSSIEQPPRSQATNVCQYEEERNLIDGNRMVVKVRRLEVEPQDILSRKSSSMSFTRPMMPASEPIVRAKAHMYPSTHKPTKIVKEKYDEEFDLTSRDFIEKFFKHVGDQHQ